MSHFNVQFVVFFAGSLKWVGFWCKLKTVISGQCNYILNYLVFDDIVKHEIHPAFDVQNFKNNPKCHLLQSSHPWVLTFHQIISQQNGCKNCHRLGLWQLKTQQKEFCHCVAFGCWTFGPWPNYYYLTSHPWANILGANRKGFATFRGHFSWDRAASSGYFAT